MSTSVKVKALPDCDICKYVEQRETPAKASFDGKTVTGQWGYMCSLHFGSHGVGLGTGLGQQLEVEVSA